MAIFKIKDANNNILIDLASSLTKISGSIITTPSQAGSITIPNPNNDRIWYHTSFAQEWDLMRRIVPISITLQGNVLSWSAHVLSNNIVYGTY